MATTATGMTVEPKALLSITACHSINWVITYPNSWWKRGKSLIGRDLAQLLRGRPVRWQNKSTLSLWFCPYASSPISCCCCCCYWPWVWSQRIVLELPRFVTSCCLCILIFPSVSCVHFFVFWVCVGKMHCTTRWSNVNREKLSAMVKRFVGFSNVVYFFVHYLSPNSVLLTPAC